ncbi:MULTISPECIES: hypothetical protein [Enterococcus]|nr:MULTISPECIES: hypothetical protein [Enterococcus]MDV7822132.1 hypothetical protein [Enterococcus gallinarum]MDV7873301.1 hypothetical protein [Enterococcus gallinarum]MDY4072605.1 hypothetical protein [Enterococcus gallinarum]
MKKRNGIWIKTRENKQDISFLQSIYKSIELLQNKDKNKGEKRV